MRGMIKSKSPYTFEKPAKKPVKGATKSKGRKALSRAPRKAGKKTEPKEPTQLKLPLVCPTPDATLVGSPRAVEPAATPTPSPVEVAIEVKAVATSGGPGGDEHPLK